MGKIIHRAFREFNTAFKYIQTKCSDVKRVSKYGNERVYAGNKTHYFYKIVSTELL